MCSEIKITVLTPTYNRAHTLPRLYNSLCRQTDFAFIWLIVDDGSNDETKSIIDRFEEKRFSIKYVYKSNGGKHTAINEGMRYVNTEYTFIVDSDDYLKENAIELVNGWIEQIRGMRGFAGVAGLRINEKNEIIGQFPQGYEYIDCPNSERKKYKLLGDKAEIYKTEILKSHPFPVYEDEKFMPESVIWNQFSLDGLNVRWYREGITVCEYLEGGLTSESRNIEYFRKNYKGYKDEFMLGFKVYRFPYNYSAASVFYARCIAINKQKAVFKENHFKLLDKFIIVLMGMLRYKMRLF